MTDLRVALYDLMLAVSQGRARWPLPKDSFDGQVLDAAMAQAVEACNAPPVDAAVRPVPDMLAVLSEIDRRAASAWAEHNQRLALGGGSDNMSRRRIAAAKAEAHEEDAALVRARIWSSTGRW